MSRLLMSLGLPGVGKTSVASALAIRMDAVHLSVDAIEESILGCGLPHGWKVGVAAYEAARVMAELNLRLGHDVQSRSAEYAPWADEHFEVDAVATPADAIAEDVVSRLMSYMALSRKVAFRVDETGVLLGGNPARYGATTAHVSWVDITGIVFWHQATGSTSMPYVGVTRREGAPALPGDGPKARAVVRYLVPVPVDVAMSSRAVERVAPRQGPLGRGGRPLRARYPRDGPPLIGVRPRWRW